MAGLTAEYIARSQRLTLVLLIGALIVFSVSSGYSFVLAVSASVGTVAVFTVTCRRDLLRGLLALADTELSIALFLAWNIGLLGGTGIQESPSYTDELDLQDSWSWELITTTLRLNFLESFQVLNGVGLLAGFLTMAPVLALRLRLRHRQEDGDERSTSCSWPHSVV